MWRNYDDTSSTSNVKSFPESLFSKSTLKIQFFMWVETLTINTRGKFTISDSRAGLVQGEATGKLSKSTVSFLENQAINRCFYLNLDPCQQRNIGNFRIHGAKFCRQLLSISYFKSRSK